MAQITRCTTEQFKKSLAGGESTEDAVLIKGFAPDIDKEIDGPGARVVQFVISTGAVDRDGDTIDPDGWDLASFQKAGSILWGHKSDDLPVAESLAVWVESGKLKARSRFMTRDVYPLSDTIYQLIQNNVIRSTSVGFKPTKWVESDRSATYGPGLDFKAQTLLEFSLVSVPANPEALIEAKSLGIDMGPYLGWLEETLDTVVKSGLLVPRNAVEKAYFATKGAPSVAVPAAIDKAGRVLSTKNLSRLTQAQEMIQEVIDSAGSIEDEEEASNEPAAVKDATPAPIVDPAPAPTVPVELPVAAPIEEPPVEAPDELVSMTDLAGFFEPPTKAHKAEHTITIHAVSSMVDDAIREALERLRGR